MQRLSLKEIVKAVNGKSNTDADILIDNVCIDTRKVTDGSLYIAIKGENFDGHDFIEKAFELGAKAVVSHRDIKTNKPVVYVKNTRLAFGALSAYYRNLFSIYLVGVTGSVGKTSTKEMIYTVMNKHYKTLKTQGNLNNDIGLPKTLFELDSSYKGAVIEMGMSNLGEISYLSKLAKPDISVITNVGVSHLENLKTRENILKAKLEILDGMNKNSKIILNADNDMLLSVKNKVTNALYVGIDNISESDIYAKNITQIGDSTAFDIVYKDKIYKAKLPTIGKHNVYNALVAFLIGCEINMQKDDIISALSEYENSGLRQHISIKNGIKVIADCYNASPDSMQSAFSVIDSIECSGKRVCVLGDMLELGESSDKMHYDVGKLACKFNIDEIYCYGKEAVNIKNGAERNGIKSVYYFDDKEKLSQMLKNNLKENDAVIFKASRGMKLEEVIEKVFCE